MTEENLRELLKLGFRQIGTFFLKRQELQFILTSCKNDTGSYAFVVDGEVKYVGVTSNTLYARMNGYKNPGPSQETNKRINPRIAQAGGVQIYFLTENEIAKFKTVIRRDEIEKEIPTDMNTFERFLISMLKPQWNRGQLQ
jgi:hypothetical protein